MTVLETAYQNFAFTKVTFDHREHLTETERKVYQLHKAGHDSARVSSMLEIKENQIDTHIRVITQKGWI